MRRREQQHLGACIRRRRKIDADVTFATAEFLCTVLPCVGARRARIPQLHLQPALQLTDPQIEVIALEIVLVTRRTARELGLVAHVVERQRLAEVRIGLLPRHGIVGIIVFVGGVIPQQDYGYLYDAGVKGIYGPGTPIPASAKDVLEQIKKALG